MTAYVITATTIGAAFCVMAVAPSLWTRKGKQ
jgi:hypothetical protein